MNLNINRLVGKKIADRYCITGEIGVGGMGRVFRAMPFDDPSHDVAIKVILRNRQLNSEDLLRFQKEAALMSRLHHPNIICFHELGLLQEESGEGNEFGSGYYIVMEIANGFNLKDSLAKDGRKDLAFFFQVGLQVTAALDYTHGKNIIHRDIKPQNIVVGKAAQEQRDLTVKVLDFGVARLAEAMHFTASADSPSSKVFQDIAGTPLYMAPEQTHLMDAPIDHRVDLYSLGCVLYEILVGRPPFSANTREKLERQHVYTTPEPLTNLRPDVPPIIEQIIHKLLSKHPDERYQTAFALHTDLLRAKRRLERRDRPSTIAFPLGLNDRFQSVSANLKLVGRDPELQQLVEGYNATAQEKGRSRLSVVQGSAGTGKTKLLSEFRNYLLKRKIRFISANFSQHENALPFNALANGFNDYLIRVLKSQPHEAEELRRKVKTLLGPTAYDVAAVVPGLKTFIPEEIEAPESGTKSEDFQTFAKAFSDFTRCLAVDNQPVVFIFDDLHWADEKSLELIDQFFSHNNSQRFFMIISHRPNDPMSSPRFKLFLEKFRKLRRRYEEINLRDFDRQTVNDMVHNMLLASSTDELGSDLVDFLSETAQGNPIRLVELVRQLVARDLIYLTSTKNAKWQYTMDAIHKAELNLNTVDLALSKIQEFQNFDKQVLETSATIGLSFQYELLLLDGQKDSVRVMQTLQKALDEGVITRVADEQELKLLGKSYSFTHWRARDAIYKNIEGERQKQLHAAIARKLEDSGVMTTPKGIFALAHHYNYSLTDHKAPDAEIAVSCIKANIIAGKTAKSAGSWQSAERYFENAYQQMLQWPHKIIGNGSRIEIIENLADLSALQRRHGDALKKYSELANYPINEQTWASVIYKTAYLQISSGIISQSINSIRSYLTRLHLKIPQNTFSERLSFYWGIFWDLLPVPINKHRLVRALKTAVSREQRGKSVSATKTIGSKLYGLAQMLFMVEKPQLGLLFHHLNLQQCIKQRSSLTQSIRTIGERAALLGYLGHFKIAYQLMDLAMDVSRNIKDKTAFGYLSLLRALSMDYVKDKEEEINEHLKAALRFLSPEEERIWYGVALEFRMYRELIKGNIQTVIKISRVVPDTIPTRNWLSARAMAITFYAYLLSDARDIIVHGGELYLKRRQKVSGRVDDLFIQMILTIVTFAKGEADKTRKYFSNAMQLFLKNKTSLEQFLFPFEEDFVALFALTLPLLFEQEHGRKLMRDNELRTLYVSLDERMGNIKGRTRGIAAMLKARALETIGNRDVKGLYDHALHSAKLCGNQLSLILTLLWFGNLLIKLGISKRSEYITRAHASATQLQLFALVEYAEKLMERRNIAYRSTNVKETQREKVNKFGSYRSQLIFEHIEHLSEVLQLDMAVEQNIEESIAILRRQYSCQRVVCLLTKGEQKKPFIIYPYEINNEESYVNYLEPYFNIRSTLFLPTNDAPWIARHEGQTQDINNTLGSSIQSLHSLNVLDQPQSITSVHGDELAQALDETIILDTSPPSLHTQPRIGPQTIKQTAAAVTVANTGTNTKKESRQKNLTMSALIPLRTQDGNRGLLFLEDVDLSGKETSLCRNELDIFGAQLGLLIQRKLVQNLDLTLSLSSHGGAFDLQQLPYRPADYSLEKVKWLNIWAHGQLREKRETTWYLGLNLSAHHYLLMYCRFNGGAEEREKVSRVIWNHMLITRSLALASGKNNFDCNELRDDIAAILTYISAAKELEAISIAYTIFDAEKHTALSGHFGPSRPLVLSTENQVTPINQVIISLNNGRDLRYWHVSAEMLGLHMYLLTHDSSKLDINLSETQKRSLRSSLLESIKRDSVHRAFEKLVLKDNIPRYYVGAIMLEANELTLENLPKLDKAE